MNITNATDLLDPSIKLICSECNESNQINVKQSWLNTGSKIKDKVTEITCNRCFPEGIRITQREP